MTNFLFVLLVGFLLVLLYETEILEPTNLAGDVTLVYVITVAMEFLTIAVIPLALKLFSFKAIHRQLVTRKGDALLPLGTARLNMLCLPMLINTFMYYQTMAPAFGYMAIILFSVSSLFILLSEDVRTKQQRRKVKLSVSNI